MVYWIIKILWGISTSICIGLWAILLEGQRVPTFPGCLRRGKRQRALTFSGLQFTSSLGKALTLLTKHGLDTEKRKEFPVEAAMESLLSTAPLMVAAAPDMDLMSCVNYFLDRCTDDNGELAERFAQMPVGRLNPKP